MEWTDDDKTNLQQTINITRLVEKTHKNLSQPLIFSKLCDIANLGLMIIAPRGKGKSAICETLCKKPLQHRDIIRIGAITYKGLQKLSAKLNNASKTVINHDISTLYTEYLRDVAINVFSQLLYDHRIDEMHTQQYDLKIENATISFLTGVQPQIYKTISKLHTFESMYKDRFIRYFMLYPYGTPQYHKQPPKIKDAIKITETAETPEELRKTKEYKRLKEMIEWHCSEGRAEDFTERLIQASTQLNGREEATISDVKWILLNTPNLLMEKWCSKRYRGVSEPLEFDPDSYTLLFTIIEKRQVTKTQLQAEFQVSTTTIHNNLKPLMGRKIIAGVYGSPQYKPHKTFWKTYIQPILNWAEFTGIQTEEGLEKWLENK